MRLADLMLPAIMVLLFLFNALLYSGVFKGEDAVRFASAAGGQASDGGVRASTPQASNRAAAAAEHAESDNSDSLPGWFVPTQGRQHTGAYPLRARVEFCQPDRVTDDCYASNPPTSGRHLPVQGTVLLADGNRLRIPPDPAVYDFEVPREAIPHLEEHAGVYVGYNCASDDCRTTVERLKDLVTQEISLGGRIIMSPDTDLDQDTIGLAAWTRVDTFDAAGYSDDRVRGFIKAHSCRFDPELFCKNVPIN